MLDTVDATVKLYDALPAGESVNVSTNNQISVADLITLICDRLDYPGEIVRKPGRPSDVMCHNASNARVRGLIDYELTAFGKGLDLTLDHYRSVFGVGP